VNTPSPGAILQNRYRITCLLGQGGMGAVYLAHDTRFSQRQVAVKINTDAAPDARAQFQVEANLLAGLRHPNLPDVTDHFILPDGRQTLVMAYVPGETLTAIVARHNPLDERTVLEWLGQVLDALIYMHQQYPPVLHRDIKPDNIKITPEGRAMLVDFGLARFYLPGQKTATGARAGSDGYAPVEQYIGGTDARSDVYSLGATLYFALTGHDPPAAPALAAGETLPRPRRFNPRISARTEAVITQAMQQSASQRYQTADAMQRALLGQDSKLNRRRLTLLAAGAALFSLLCIISAVGFFSLREENKPTPTRAIPIILPTEAATASSAPITTAPASVEPAPTMPSGTPDHPSQATSTAVTIATTPLSVESAPTLPPDTPEQTSGAMSTAVPTYTPTNTPTATRRPPTYTPNPTSTPVGPTPPPPSTQPPTQPSSTQPPPTATNKPAPTQSLSTQPPQPPTATSKPPPAMTATRED
jgi:serine/threonine protein kinase